MSKRYRRIDPCAASQSKPAQQTWRAPSPLRGRVGGGAGGEAQAYYLIERFNAFTMPPHFLTSSLNMASASPCEPAIGSKPSAFSLSCTALLLTVSLIAPLSAARICGSVLAGAKMPTQDAAVKFAKPCSA